MDIEVDGTEIRRICLIRFPTRIGRTLFTSSQLRIFDSDLGEAKVISVIGHSASSIERGGI